MKIIIVILSVVSSPLFAETLRVHDPAVAGNAAYTSAEFNSSIPYWIWNGQLIDLKKANEVIDNPSELICSLWMMDWTEEKNLTKENLKSKLFFEVDQLNLWKRVSGKTIFATQTIEAALSYTCVQKTSSGELKEIDVIDDGVFNTVFKGIVEIIE